MINENAGKKKHKKRSSRYTGNWIIIVTFELENSSTIVHVSFHLTNQGGCGNLCGGVRDECDIEVYMFYLQGIFLLDVYIGI